MLKGADNLLEISNGDVQYLLKEKEKDKEKDKEKEKYHHQKKKKMMVMMEWMDALYNTSCFNRERKGV